MIVDGQSRSLHNLIGWAEEFATAGKGAGRGGAPTASRSRVPVSSYARLLVRGRRRGCHGRAVGEGGGKLGVCGSDRYQ